MNNNKIINDLEKKFLEIFGESKPDQKLYCFRAPARVNIIGEHTDYNDGFVMPISINKKIYLLIRKRDDLNFNLISLNYPDKKITNFDINKIEKTNNWTDYPKGIISILTKLGYKLSGMDMLYWGDIPIASGLSSSAAIEVVTCYAFNIVNGLNIDRKQIALLSQKAENEFVGMKCGIMDQFIITLGREDNALLIDCRSLDYEYIPLELKDIGIVVCNTKLPRKLITSEYNLRREECDKGVEILKQYLPEIKKLRDVNIEQFEKYKNNLPENIRKRCEHVIQENNRVIKAKQAIKNKNFIDLGKLLIQSHNSLRYLYEVSCPELDTMVESVITKYDVYGARMIGAGFGGCVIAMVKKYIIDKFISKVYAEYKTKTGIIPEFYVCDIIDGVCEIKK